MISISQNVQQLLLLTAIAIVQIRPFQLLSGQIVTRDIVTVGKIVIHVTMSPTEALI
jgi:hypothetical protein